MKQRYAHWFTLPGLLTLAAALALAPAATHAQAPAWGLATTGNPTPLNGQSQTQAVATDASGNVFVTGSFSGTVAFGNSVLVSAGLNDLFVAKYVPATNTWAWAASGGGSSYDGGLALAVSGTSVYVTGSISNNSTDAYAVRVGGSGATAGTVPVIGTSPTLSADLLVLKYLDQGTTATLSWTQVGGGTGTDGGTGIAVSGSSVYITGNIFNNAADANGVRFGGSGTTAGTVPVGGASATASFDLLVAKYTDNGTTAALSWTQVGGGTGEDRGQGIAASGPNVYVTGSLLNSRTNANGVLFGSTGTTAGTTVVNGAGTTATSDLVLAKYVDNGPTASVGWVQVGGGTGPDYGYAVGVSGTSVYVAGSIANSQANGQQVVFGGAGTTAGTVPQYGATATASQDVVLAKYTDNGPTASVGWTQVGGGTGDDYGYGLVVSGSSVYITGFLTNNSTNLTNALFGGAGTSVGTTVVPGVSGIAAYDLLVAKYTDNGPTASVSWTQVAGGSGPDMGTGLGLSGGQLYAGGYVGQPSPATFGTALGSPVLATVGSKAVLGTLAAAAGTWQMVATPNNGGTSQVRATATDASGNVFVTGTFYGQLTLGSTTLYDQAGGDLFVAKYVPATGTWAWVVSGGGINGDAGQGIAVSGNSVYVTGTISNNSTDDYGVRFGGSGASAGTVPVRGISASLSGDVVVAKYTDQGSSASLAWVQVGGGTSGDIGYGIAVSGSSVYVTGSIFNNTANTNAVLFGDNGTTAGTVPVRGASPTASPDLVVVKYLDQGSSAAVAWAQVGGGTGEDYGYGLAVRAPNVFVTGYITNSRSSSLGVLFGGNGTAGGTVPVNGASATPTPDLVVVKYFDNGPSATVTWTQVGGGAGNDFGNAIAVSGDNVYVTGIVNNNTANDRAVVFGGTGTTAGSTVVRGASATVSFDILLTKYVDNGTSAAVGWAQVGGGTADDRGYGVAVNGSNVFVVGWLSSNLANTTGAVLGGDGTTPGTTPVPGLGTTASYDLLVANYLDNGPTASLGWTQVGGGASADFGYGLALSASSLYVVGSVQPAATFGSLAVAGPAATSLGFLGGFAVSGLLAAAPASPRVGLSLYPNPGATTLRGAPAGTPVLVFDALGRRVATSAADASGTAALPVGLAPGLYVVRAGAGTVRWVVE